MKNKIILCFLFVLFFASSSLSQEKKDKTAVLISAYGTSYSENSSNAVSLLDPDFQGYWQPQSKDAGVSEGVYFQFKDPVFINSIAVSVEGDAYGLSLQPYLDGQTQTKKPEKRVINGSEATVFYDIAVSPSVSRENGYATFFIKENEYPVIENYRYDRRDTYSNLNCTVKSVFIKINNAKSLPSIKSVKIFGKDEKNPIKIQLPLTPAASVKASSVLTPKIAYSPEHLFDSQTDMAWSTNGKETDGINQSATVSFDKETEIAGIMIWNGYQRSDAHYYANGRVKKLDVNGQAADVKDNKKHQTILFPKPVNAKEITLTIKEIYKGSKYKDVLISELRFITPDGKIILPRVKTKAAALSKTYSLKTDTTYANLVAITENGKDIVETFRLRSNGSFVLYKRSGVGEMSVAEGNWEETGANKIRVFGKKYRAPEPSIGIDYLRQVNASASSEASVPVIFQSEIIAAPFNSLTKEQKKEASDFVFSFHVDSGYEDGDRVPVREGYSFANGDISYLEENDPIYIKSDIYVGFMIPY